MAAVAASVVPALKDRPVKNTICLFDVDGTLTPARRVSLLELHLAKDIMLNELFQSVSPEMLQLLSQLRHKVAIGFVGGSDLVKITEQLQVGNNNGAFYRPGDPRAIRILRCDELQCLTISTLLSRKTV